MKFGNGTVRSRECSPLGCITLELCWQGFRVSFARKRVSGYMDVFREHLAASPVLDCHDFMYVFPSFPDATLYSWPFATNTTSAEGAANKESKHTLVSW